jgi:hypothetical protein
MNIRSGSRRLAVVIWVIGAVLGAAVIVVEERLYEPYETLCPPLPPAPAPAFPDRPTEEMSISEIKMELERLYNLDGDFEDPKYEAEMRKKEEWKCREAFRTGVYQEALLSIPVFELIWAIGVVGAYWAILWVSRGVIAAVRWVMAGFRDNPD